MSHVVSLLLLVSVYIYTHTHIVFEALFVCFSAYICNALEEKIPAILSHVFIVLSHTVYRYTSREGNSLTDKAQRSYYSLNSSLFLNISGSLCI
jgi:hypothetical protein